MSSLEPTRRQKEVLEAIKLYKSQNGYPPSFRELGEVLGLKSPSTISGMLDSLRKKGYVTWQEGRPRTLQILKTTETTA
ncbi:transcriptional regulator [Bacillus sp. mrc49]|uniref:LexA family protein n=1 Tax=Bacillus sp. mrc49 TaxID=2054913 RepID=UPI000C273F9A|nr:transcriptional regulator [Bacillus sp. mrc49]PJN91312.1 transcriptional regulator [Bacillus sp. mrc49]